MKLHVHGLPSPRGSTPAHPSARRPWRLQQSVGRSPEQLQGSWGSLSRPPCSLQRVDIGADRVWAPAAPRGTACQGYCSSFMPLPAAALTTPFPAHQSSSSRSVDLLGATAGHWRPRHCCTVPGRQQPALRTPQASPRAGWCQPPRHAAAAETCCLNWKSVCGPRLQVSREVVDARSRRFKLKRLPPGACAPGAACARFTGWFCALEQAPARTATQ